MTAIPPAVFQHDPSTEAESRAHESACAVCAHELADHDPIGLRFCQATEAHALPRHCICPNR